MAAGPPAGPTDNKNSGRSASCHATVCPHPAKPPGPISARHKPDRRARRSPRIRKDIGETEFVEQHKLETHDESPAASGSSRCSITEAERLVEPRVRVAFGNQP